MIHGNLAPQKITDWNNVLVLEESLQGNTIRYLRSFESADMAIEAGKYVAWDHGIRFSMPIDVPPTVQALLADPAQGELVHRFLLNLVQANVDFHGVSPRSLEE